MRTFVVNQGFYISRQYTADQITAWVIENNRPSSQKNYEQFAEEMFEAELEKMNAMTLYNEASAGDVEVEEY
jgi:hypothetical protein